MDHQGSTLLVIAYGTINILTTEAVFLASLRTSPSMRQIWGRTERDGVVTEWWAVGAVADGLTDGLVDKWQSKTQ